MQACLSLLLSKCHIVGNHVSRFIFPCFHFQFAVVAKNTETVSLLINAGADVSCMDGGGKTPLTNLIWDYVRAYANTETISEDSWTIVKMLIEARTDLDNCSREFSNPIVTAATFKCAPLVQYLLENGASIKLKCKYTIKL